MATLQEQYIQIQEGKGNKNHFLKQAQYLFPDLVSVYNSYTEVVHILKGKNVLNESKAGLGMVSTPSRRIEDWVSIFQESIKAEEKKVSKEVTDTQDHNFDYKDTKNIDNIYGQAFLNGFYDEMKDPKNKNKTADEVKQIVAKNLGKDILYYTTNAQFGVKGIGYQTEAPGLGTPKEPKGKYKSSGYGDIQKKTVKESKINENYGSKDDFSGSGLIVVGRTQIDNNQISDMLDETDYYGIWNAMEGYWFFPEDESTFSYLEADLDEEFAKREINARFEGQYDESLNEAKRPNLASELKGKYKSSGYGDLPKKKKD
jgi:gas vesicle protein